MLSGPVAGQGSGGFATPSEGPAAIRRDARWAKSDELTVAIEEAQLERDLAASDLDMMREAQEILARVSPKLMPKGVPRLRASSSWSRG